MNKIMNVKCPTCDEKFNYYQSEFRPFCCEKCKMIDLGHWFEESYRVPTKETVIEHNESIETESEYDDEN